MTKESIHQLAIDLSKDGRNRKNLVRGKVKCMIILPEYLDDDNNELYARAAHILEDASKKMELVEE